MSAPRRYVSSEEDSGRWDGFAFRDGDIVISTRSKSGTTWMQMICAVLVFGSPDLPEPLGRISPWFDHLVTPLDDVAAQLAAQTHRRVIKTHTPLDGVPIDPRAKYIVVARHPLDMAVSLYHQSDNIDRDRVRALTGQPEPTTPPAPRKSLHEWLLSWIDSEASPFDAMDSLPGVMWHLSDAWERRDETNVLLVHYDELLADLDGQMNRIATWLDIAPDLSVWSSLVDAARFDHMRSRATDLVSAAGVLKEPSAFFRRGRSGAAREVLDDGELSHYYDRAAELASPALLAWLHR